MIVHIIPNHRFISAISERFEVVFPDENLWFVINNDKVTVTADSELIRNIDKKVFWGEFKKRLGRKADLICVHCLDGNNTRIAQELVDEGYKVLPFLWAGEYAKLLSENPLDRYFPRTKKYVLGQQSVVRSFYNRLLDATGGRLSCMKTLLRGGSELKLQQLWLLNSVPYFVTPVREEAEIIIRKNRLSCRFLPFQYSWLDREVLDFQSVADGSASEVQVGHSGWPQNNHLDVFNLLTHERLRSKSVVCTLAYGDPLYLKFIEREGRFLFNSKFRAIKDFVPRAEYFMGMQEVSTYIAAQRIQFGLGNVKNLVAMGKRVVMPRENPMFSNLQSLGVELSDLREAAFTLEPLPDSVAQRNREIAARYWGRDHIIRESQKSLQAVVEGK